MFTLGVHCLIRFQSNQADNGESEEGAANACLVDVFYRVWLNESPGRKLN